jgi:hypothetical protein
VSEQPAGLLLQSSEIYGHEIDEYCTYPIINSKTGGRMHTFASWQMEMNRSLRYSGRATGVLVIEIEKSSRPLRAKSYCRAFTELNIQAAESKGVHERQLLEALGGKETVAPASRARVTIVEAPIPPEEGAGPGSVSEVPNSATPAQDAEEPAAPSQAAREPCDLDAELRKLDRLRKDDLLTEQEFQEQKQRVLARCG